MENLDGRKELSNDTSNELTTQSSTSGKIFLQSSKLNPLMKASMLRPSQFQFNTSSTNTNNNDDSNKTDDSKLNELDKIDNDNNAANTSKTVNPFLRNQSDDNTPDNSDDITHFNSLNKKSDTVAENTNNTNDKLSLLNKNGLAKSSLFSTGQTTTIPINDNKNFVFGQNVHERVTGEFVQNKNETKDEEESGTSSSSNNLLFASAVPKPNENQELPTIKDSDSKSLTEAAREYEESRAQKRKYEEVETFTGEEDEINVFDVNCKLFAFVSSCWEERGRGNLRLNDSKNLSNTSRVVFRTAGNLRVLVNTKVWSGMLAEKPSEKSFRLTVIDNTGQIKVFLVMARPENINLIYSALKKRINIEKKKMPNDKSDLINEKNTNETEGAAIPADNETDEPNSKKFADNYDSDESS